ncbi:ImmA/IrrE family metallo-endopeptidase [Amycolatopsis sp. DG1A-15b]|uniref:ImmA/IrrE family metallo-endopeptidase n=1 Tax=Amycolatopsis sp. DG1A-15b TaxID=3052846 RepID=UPI00255BE11D|nr:ImmA/IrrE family metallo-endopeptidase [Amycolatopsis sp. DG1A-15b]WIX90544.1 ImmA/IrrE family metallo-endopeptidase [Amycolatopsis sp. DG1A-15b]
MTDPLRSAGASLSVVRRAIEGVLDELTWPVPFDLNALLEQIAGRCGKRVALLATALPRDGAGGLVIERAQDLVIVVDETLPPLQREHVIMHEAAHVLFGHRGTSVGDLTHEELDELDPEAVRGAQRFAKRAGYSAIEEKVAEIAAALMSVRAGAVRRRGVRPRRSDVVAEVNKRFEEALLVRRPRW